MRKLFPQLHPIKVLDSRDLVLQIVDKSWATATIIEQTWILLYFDHILQTLTIGIPHDWNPMQRAAILATFKPTFTKFDYRPMPLVPEGWCGPLTIAYLLFWLGIHEGEPIEQLQTIHELALSQHNRIQNSRDAKFVAGGPKQQIAIPRIITPEISQIAFRITFFPHDARPQPYSYRSWEIEYRYLDPYHYRFWEFDFFLDAWKYSAETGLPPAGWKPSSFLATKSPLEIS